MLKLQLLASEARRLPCPGWYFISVHRDPAPGSEAILHTSVLPRSEKNSIHWNDELVIPVMHEQITLYWRLNMRIIHNSSWEVLANGSIPIASLTAGKQHVQSQHFDNGIFDKFHVEMTLLLAKNDNMIQILSVEDSQSMTVGQNAVQMECKYLAERRYFDFLDSQVAHDCIDDIGHLLESVPSHADNNNINNNDGSNNDSSDNTEGEIHTVRCTLKLRKSSKITFEQRSCTPCSPIEDNSIQVNLCADETKFVVVTLPSRFSMWTWAKWLQLAYDVWSGSLRKSELPEWARNTSLCLVSQGSLVGYQEKSAEGRVTLDLERPFELQCGPDTFSLHNMVSMVIAVDSVCAHKRYCVVTVDRVDNDVKHLEASHRKGPLRVAIKSATELSSNLLAKGGEMARAAVSGLLHRHPDHTAAISAAIHSDKSFIVARSEGATSVFLEESDGRWTESAIVDIDLPAVGRGGPGLTLCLYHRGGKLVGDAALSLDSVLPSIAPLSPGPRAVRIPTVPRLGPLTCARKLTVGFTSASKFKLSLLSCHGLALPAKSLKLSQVLVKCTLLGASGHRNNHVARIFETTPTALSRDPVWTTEDFLVDVGDELHSMEFVRLEVLACGHLAALGRVSLGAAFLPLGSFTDDATDCVLAVDNFRRTKDLVVGPWASEPAPGSSAFGSITVRMQRLPGDRPVAVADLSVLSSATVLTHTAWMGEALLTGDVHQPQAATERLAVTVAHDALEVDVLLPPPPRGAALDAHKRWRHKMAQTCPHAVLATCRERIATESTVRIDYSRVQSCAQVSSSVVAVIFTVARYLGGAKDKDDRFGDAQVCVFVSNCPAAQLQAVVEDRVAFHALRAQIGGILSRGCIRSAADDAAGLGRGVDDYDDRLAEATEVFAEMDYQAWAGEQAVAKALLAEASVDRPVLRTLRFVTRMRLYMAAMLAAGLAGDVAFSPEACRDVLQADVQRMRRIQLENSVATANNRVEYLLDMAEKRIRDAALCGWKHRGENLQRCLEIFANGYFIEIVGILGVFFEDVGQSSVKGLTSKVELINTYMKHNDRLDVIIESALRPYGLKAKPAAKLSLFLDLGILVSWYTSVLTMEMRSRVESVLDVWKDASKDVTGRAQQYKFPLPWIPQRAGASSGIFFTNIPEDLVEMLMTYLTFARIRKENIAPSFQSEIWKLDTKVCLAYTNAFLHLAEGYQRALGAKHWRGLVEDDDDEVAEYVTFLCSVANDASRVSTEALFCIRDSAEALPPSGATTTTATAAETLPRRPPPSEGLSISEMQILAAVAFDDVVVRSLDQLSCLVFRSVFKDRDVLLSDRFHTVWQRVVRATQAVSRGGERADPSLPEAVGDGGDDDVDLADLRLFALVVHDMVDVVLDLSPLLDAVPFGVLLELCGNKLLVLLFALMRALRTDGIALTASSHPSHRARMVEDVQAIEQGLARLMHALDTTDRAHLRKHVQRVQETLTCVSALLFADVLTVPFITQIKTLLALAQQDPSRAYSLYRLLQACFALRGFKQCMSRRRSMVQGALGQQASRASRTDQSEAVLEQVVAEQRLLEAADEDSDKDKPWPAAEAVGLEADPFAKEIRRLKVDYAREWALDMFAKVAACSDAHRLHEVQQADGSEGKDGTGRETVARTVPALRRTPDYLVFARDKPRPHLEALLIYPAMETSAMSTATTTGPWQGAGHPSDRNSDAQFAVDLSQGPALRALNASRHRIRRLLRSLPATAVGRMDGPTSASTPGTSPSATRIVLSITDLVVRGGLRFAAHSATPVFLRFQLGDEVVRTAKQTLACGASCHFEDAVVLSLRPSADLVRLHVTLWEEVMFVAQKLASYTLEFVAFSPPSWRNKDVDWVWVDAARVQLALRRGQKRGEQPPSLSFSLTANA